MKEIKVIALTHKQIELDKIGNFHLSDDKVEPRLKQLKAKTDIEELMYLSTCNRVEFIFTSYSAIDDDCLLSFFHAFNPEAGETELKFACQNAEYHEGTDAVRHLFKVASSIDSLVLGEREIITQVRTAYENSHKMGLTGDTLRLLTESTIQAAKAVYTQTNVATKPVSVVSLAYRKLKYLNPPLDSKILVIGSGKTNTNMCRFLHKHGFTDYTLYNRTIKNGDQLASILNCDTKPLRDLKIHTGGFDIIVTCTGADNCIVTKENYPALVDGCDKKKIVIDLAIPNDFDRSIKDNNNVKMIAVEDLRTEADKNLKEREKELVVCDKIIQHHLDVFCSLYRERRVELAMMDVPNKVKEIKEMALNTVFVNELSSLDENSKEVLDKVVEYLEKKYISVPMKMAKEILLEQ